LGMILDTTAVSAAGFGDPLLVQQLANHKNLYVPVIVVGEYRYGLAGSTKAVATQLWFDRFLATVIVLNVTRDTAACYATIFTKLKEQGRPIPINDVWIAALAVEHRLPIMSRDAHFDAVPNLRRHVW